MHPTEQGNVATAVASPSLLSRPDNALQVLAATASNDQLRERYLDDKSSTNSKASPQSNHNDGMMKNLDEGAAPADDKSSDANNSEDDDSGSGCSGSGSSCTANISKTTGMRKGKWTMEEEEFATRFIHYFSSGLLCLPEGKTLRASLAEKLKCDPMRITKKYGGASCLGNKISKLCNRPRFLARDIEMANLEIARLERRFHLRMAQGGDLPLFSDSENDVPTAGIHAVASTTSILPSATSALPPSAGNGLHSVDDDFSPLKSESSVNPVLTSFPSQAASVIPQATTVPSLSSYLATLAGNAQLAAKAQSTSAHSAPLAFGLPPPTKQQESQAATTSFLQQNINSMQIPLTLPQTIIPATIPSVNWPLVCQGIIQASMKNKTANLSSGNEQLVQTLLLQISSQLQALAALSPSTMKQIQLQILAATTSAHIIPPAPPAPAQAPAPAEAQLLWTTTSPPATSLLSNFQLAAARQVQSGLVNDGGVPKNVELLNTVPVSQASIGNSINSSLSNSQSFSQIPLSKPSHVHQHLPSTSSQGVLPIKNESSNLSSKVVQCSGLSSTTTTAPVHSNNMEEFLIKLRQRHTEAIEQAQREQSLDQHHGPASKTQKKTILNDSGIVTLLEHATTVSSGSGCTTNEGSTSSVENTPASDETRNDGSTSSNSSSEEDDTESGGEKATTSSFRSTKPSIPPRKRFRSENNGGITRRNLADHNHRMAEEMKNQDK